MSVDYRPARPDDQAALTEIYNHYVSQTIATFDLTPKTVAERAPWFEEHALQGPYRLWVATEPEGRVVGFASTSRFRPRPAYSSTVESSVYVHPHSIGRGIGRGLYRALFNAVAAEELHRIVAIIALPNPASVALHERFGFSLTGTLHEVGFKFGRFWDVAHYERAQDQYAIRRTSGIARAATPETTKPTPTIVSK